MRGTLFAVGAVGGEFGIIPAYAGNTSSERESTTGSRDHPRICGEHYAVEYKGKPFGGIIPAYAGNTRNGRTGCAGFGGSSPHMRGTRVRRCAKSSIRGIIPAYAGNTDGKSATAA